MNRVGKWLLLSVFAADTYVAPKSTVVEYGRDNQVLCRFDLRAVDFLRKV